MEMLCTIATATICRIDHEACMEGSTDAVMANMQQYEVTSTNILQKCPPQW